MMRLLDRVEGAPPAAIRQAYSVTLPPPPVRLK